jgi:hypothetical protein
MRIKLFTFVNVTIFYFHGQVYSGALGFENGRVCFTKAPQDAFFKGSSSFYGKHNLILYLRHEETNICIYSKDLDFN